MKVAIVGSRPDNWFNPTTRDNLVRMAVMNLVYSLPKDTVVVSGGAQGPDQWAVITAQSRNLPDPVVFQADWKRYGKSAGFRRNPDIIAEADYVIAFWDGLSKGTANSIGLARKMGKPVVTFIGVNYG